MIYLTAAALWGVVCMYFWAVFLRPMQPAPIRPRVDREPAQDPAWWPAGVTRD